MTSPNTTRTMASDNQDTPRPNFSWKRSILRASSRITYPPSTCDGRPEGSAGSGALEGRTEASVPHAAGSAAQRAVVPAFDLGPVGCCGVELRVRGGHLLGQGTLVGL